MELIVVFGGLVLLFVVLFKIKSGFKKYQAAMNALLAKNTFQHLNAEERKRVINQTIEMFIQTGLGEDRFHKLDDRERFGFIALSMAELYIRPIPSDYDWAIVKNPFTALISAEKQIKVAKRELQINHGVNIDV